MSSSGSMELKHSDYYRPEARPRTNPVRIVPGRARMLVVVGTTLPGISINTVPLLWAVPGCK